MGRRKNVLPQILSLAVKTKAPGKKCCQEWKPSPKTISNKIFKVVILVIFYSLGKGEDEGGIMEYPFL